MEEMTSTTCQTKNTLGHSESIKFLSISGGKYFAIVDEECFEELIRFSWRGRRGHSTIYVQRHTPRVKYKRTSVSLHRQVMEAKKGEYVDHINGDGLDNRKSNLRICTNAQNGHNRGAEVGALSKYKGVGWCSRTKKWQVSITHLGKKKFLGRFSDEVTAAQAYDVAAKKLQGEFARLNFE